jgi:hypothetical protein
MKENSGEHNYGVKVLDFYKGMNCGKDWLNKKADG